MGKKESQKQHPAQPSDIPSERAVDVSMDTEVKFDVLMAKARGGDAIAAGLLVENYRKYLLLIANKDFDKNLQAKIGASDIVQESMMQAQNKIHQFKGKTENEWRGWLRAILNNDLTNCRRKYSTKKRNTHQEVNIQDQSEVARGLADDHLTPSSEAVKIEKAKILAAAIAKLDSNYKDVIQLRNFEQKSFEEIGPLMNRSPDAARKLWARAIELLQQILTQDCPELISGQHWPIEDHD